MKRIAIIGAAGYVGLELARQLRGCNYEVNAIVRENGMFLLRDSGFNLVAPSNMSSLGKVDVVLNLAYPTSGLVQFYPLKNKEILETIKSLMTSHSRLIHVSTQAVFGFGMERPVIVGRVPDVRDYPYIEAKIELENLILHNFKNQAVQIVRLGNVWGPGSGWTVPFVNKILFKEAVGVQGIDGYCNATDVANVSSFLAYLVGHDNASGTEFYHLAEFSEYRWSAWIRRIESLLGEAAVYEPNLPLYPASLSQEIQKAVSPIMPGPLYRTLVCGRFCASWLRSLLRVLGEQRYARIKKISPKALPAGYALDPSEALFLTILSSQTRFETSVPKEWVPPLNFEESWARVENWVKSAGYL